MTPLLLHLKEGAIPLSVTQHFLSIYKQLTGIHYQSVQLARQEGFLKNCFNSLLD